MKTKKLIVLAMAVAMLLTVFAVVSATSVKMIVVSPPRTIDRVSNQEIESFPASLTDVAPTICGPYSWKVTLTPRT